MREILFRGKHIHALPKNEHLDGTWIHGYLCDENYINSPELKGEFLVDPETVCQYTGLTNKSGRKIFEGDIIRYTDGLIGKEKMDEVKYNETHAAFCRLHKSEMGFQYLFIDEAVANKCEVVGNIFDNPELLKGAQDAEEAQFLDFASELETPAAAVLKEGLKNLCKAAGVEVSDGKETP